MEESSNTLGTVNYVTLPHGSSTSGNGHAPPSHQLSQFEWAGHTYQLRQPVTYRVSYDDGWIYECERYGLHAFAADKDETFAQFHEEFAFLYDGLVNEPDETLTQDAVELKRLILADVVSAN